MLLCDDNLDVLEELTPDRTKYSYDGLNRRITQTQPAEDPRDFYYSANWQIVEERLGSTTDAQYVWSPVYVDAIVFRDTATNVGNTPPSAASPCRTPTSTSPAS
jgi:YD repeat-containing protein